MNFIKKKWKLFFLFLILGIPLSITIYFFRLKIIDVNILNPSKERLESIYVKQAYKDKIKKLLKPYIGQSLLFLDFKEIFRILKKENIFLNLSLYKQFPNTLKINLKLNSRFFLYLNKKGQLYKILNNGKLLKITSKKKYSAPILIGKLPKNKKKKQQFLQFIFKLLDFKLFGNKISTIQYLSNQEIQLFLEQPYLKVKLNYSRLTLDKKANLKNIIKKIEKVLNYLSQNSYKAHIIDARFLNKIFVSYQ